jgi:hypothetical protein
LFAFFLSSGIGHFYCGRILFAVSKLLCLIIPIIFGIILNFNSFFREPIYSKNKRTELTEYEFKMSLLSSLLLISLVIWQILDLVMFDLIYKMMEPGYNLKHGERINY